MKLTMLLVVFSVISISFVSAQGAPCEKEEVKSFKLSSVSNPVWRLTDQDWCERVGSSTIAPTYLLTHMDDTRTREIKIQRDHERDDHHQWVIEFREVQYLDPPQVGHPRREVRRSFRMVGTRHSAIVAIDNLPRKVSSRKMGRIFLMSVAERLHHYHPPNILAETALYEDVFAMLNEIRFEDLVSLK